jgi:putative flippase GtrA
MIDNQKIRYFLAGLFNTLAGYCIGVWFYSLFHYYLNTFYILVLANIVSISISFLTYKVFVFKTKSNWVPEYLRCYLVYGHIVLIGMFIIWVMVDFLRMPFWISQALALMITVFFSYIAHGRFTFRKNVE